MKIKIGDRYRDYVGTIYEVYEYKNKIIKFLVDNKTFEIYTKNQFESECMGNRFHKAQLPQQEISDGVIPPNSFILSLNREEPIIIIDEEGFKYKGELIKDSGEIYKLFKEFLQTSLLPQQEISDEEIEKISNKFIFKENGYFFKQGAKWYREQLKKKQNGTI